MKERVSYNFQIAFDFDPEGTIPYSQQAAEILTELGFHVSLPTDTARYPIIAFFKGNEA